MKRKKTYLFLVLMLVACAPAGLAQTISAVAKTQTDAPIRVTSGECAAVQAGGVKCKAVLKINETGLWSAYGLLWKLTFENGRSTMLSSTADAMVKPGPNPGALTPGDAMNDEVSGFGMKSPDGKDLRLIGAEVSLEFAVPALGPAWGNTKSASYSRLMNIRQGFTQAMEYLKSVYAKQGSEATLKAIGVR